MLEVNFSPFPELRTLRCRLRQIRPEDAPQVLRLRSDDQVLQYLEREKMQTLAEAHGFIALLQQQWQENNAVNWVLCLDPSEEMIGTVAFWRLEKEHYRAEIGYTLLPEYWGRGLMHEVLQLVLPYGFKQIGLHSIEANVNPNNTASIRLLERNGFVREAYFRENYYFRGKFLDSAVYSLLESTFVTT